MLIRIAQNLQNSHSFSSKRFLVVAVLLGLLISPARAQQQEEQRGIEQGNYNIKQSIEFGGRFTSVGGDVQAYDTFVNLQQGPRLLGFTTEMRSLDHHATLFDRLYFSNFGYGGDPNMVSRLRITKNRWYDFDALFRKDENVWDYSLQTNPLNPTTPFANGPAGYAAPACTSCVLSMSPHLFNTRRKLGDYGLILLPDSKIRVRAGYSRNIVEGPGFSSIHEGTEQALFEDYKTTVNTYRIGVDFRLLPRTNISYDQIWNYYKGDTGITDPFQNPLFHLSNGTAVDLGWSLNAGANQPCGTTFAGPPAGNVNPTCSAAFSYLSHGRIRTNTPTEQLSLQSNYWNNLDLSGRVSYSGGDTNDFGYNDNFFGRVSRTNARNDGFTGPIHGRRVAATADFGATWHITDKLSFLDSFHFANWHNPDAFLSTECSFFSPNLLTPANAFNSVAVLPATCAAPAGSVAGTPVHSTSSGPDISLLNVSQFLKQDEKTNLAELEYRFSSRWGARLGYRYRNRSIVDTGLASGTFVFFPNLQNSRTGPAPFSTGPCPVANNLADGTCILTMAPQASGFSIPIHEHAAVFGIWARPNNNWQISFDTELMSADNTFTRISPRQSQEYRIRSKYKVTDWMNLNGSVTIWEGRNNVFEDNNLQHNRTYGFSTIFQPNEKVSLELGYDYNDVYSQILICITSSAVPVGPTTVGCAGLPGLTQETSVYTNTSNFGYFDASWTPILRLTARLGANLTGTSGSALISITPNAPSGSLDSKYLQPFGGIDYRFGTNWTGKAYWGYYGYHEDASSVVQDFLAPRNFRANLVTLSLRYAF
jgi:hypothetical protein